MAVNTITRSDLSGLIPEPVTREIIQGVTEGSAVLSMGRRLPNMTSKTVAMNVLDALPTASKALYFRRLSIRGENTTPLRPRRSSGR